LTSNRTGRKEKELLRGEKPEDEPSQVRAITKALVPLSSTFLRKVEQKGTGHKRRRGPDKRLHLASNSLRGREMPFC